VTPLPTCDIDVPARDLRTYDALTLEA